MFRVYLILTALWIPPIVHSAKSVSNSKPTGTGKTCPPSCQPAASIQGCKAYVANSKCENDIRDVSTPEASCGCMWQTYIQAIEPQTKIIFTEDGNQCYKWAAALCSYLEEKNKISIAKPLQDILRRVQRLEEQGGKALEHEIAKSRRRTGVVFKMRAKENGVKKKKGDNQSSSIKKSSPAPKVNYIGKHSRSGSSDYVEVSKVVGDGGNKVPSVSKKKVVHHHIHHHWFDVNIQDDQFKLGIFMIILLLNLMVVLVLIFCRGSSKSGSKEQLMAGDLDPALFPEAKKSGTQQIKDFPKSWLDHVKGGLRGHKNKPRPPSYTRLQMEEEDPDNFHKALKQYHEQNVAIHHTGSGRGLYENIDSDLELDRTYEVPTPIPPLVRDFHPRKYSLATDSEGDSSPTKYFPRSPREQKNVHFALPPGVFLTLQDRVDAHRSSAAQEARGEGYDAPLPNGQ